MQELIDYEISRRVDEATELEQAGLFEEAAEAWRQLLSYSEATFGPDHIETAIIINNLAHLYYRMALFGKAESLYKRSLAIREKVLGLNHPSTAIAVNNLAQLYQRQGLFAQAELLYKRSLAIREDAMGDEDPATATALNNLAFLYYVQGLFGKAEPLYRRSLAIKERMLEQNHPSIANGLNNLALLYVAMGLFDLAEPLYRRALLIRESALGFCHPDTAQSLNNLARLYNLQGFYSRAESLYRLAVMILEQAMGPEHPDNARVFNNMASNYDEQGLCTQAMSVYSLALAIQEQTLGKDHPDTAVILYNLALHCIGQENYGAALDYLAQGASIDTSFLLRESPFQPRAQRTALSNRLGDSLLAAFSLANSSQDGATLALSTRLLRHGLLLEIEQAQASLGRAPSPTQDLAQKVAAINSRISDVQISPDQRKKLLQQRDDLEQQLFRQWPNLQIPLITQEQIAAALPPEGVLVEFQRFRPWQGGSDPSKRWGQQRYLALTLKASGEISAVELGEAQSLDEAISQALRASVEGQIDADQLWEKVSQFVLKPLATPLAGSRQWFLSPDGELHRVPFAALPSPTSPGVALARAVQLRLITTGRDLVRFQEPSPAGRPPLVLANPNFDRGQPAPAARIAASQPQQRSSGLKERRWAALPATAREGEEIAMLLGTAPISGESASVGVLERSIGPRVLHIASHGFFEKDQELPPADPRHALFASGGRVAGFQGEDPLLRSGIVLAGANNPGLDPNDDGLLTALEATALQLDGTELVVLSACSTGSGDIRSGEGLYGLQRALTVAGARSTLLSLWKVDDAATAEFMVRFYRRLKAGEGRADALAAVQAEFRTGEVKGPAGEDWARPYYWAAWQLVGDWRPIEGL